MLTKGEQAVRGDNTKIKRIKSLTRFFRLGRPAVGGAWKEASRRSPTRGQAEWVKTKEQGRRAVRGASRTSTAKVPKTGRNLTDANRQRLLVPSFQSKAGSKAEGATAHRAVGVHRLCRPLAVKKKRLAKVRR
jgi:hypothetical protein